MPDANTPILQCGRYALGERLTRGYLMETFRGHVPKGPEGGVAVRRVLPHLAVDAQFIQTLTSDLARAGELEHGGIVPIFEIGMNAGVPFVANALVVGPSLAQVIEWAPHASALPYELQAEIVAACAEALAHAHEAGMVHGGLKPPDILFNHSGTVLLSDIGIVPAAMASPHVAAGFLRSRLPYLAPERLAVDAQMDAPSDVYTLGIILFELATGTTPFAAPHDFALVKLISDTPVPSAREVAQAVPETLAALIADATQRDPNNRPTAADLTASLRQFVSGRRPPVGPDEILACVKQLARQRGESAFEPAGSPRPERTPLEALPPKDGTTQTADVAALMRGDFDQPPFEDATVVSKSPFLTVGSDDGRTRVDVLVFADGSDPTVADDTITDGTAVSHDSSDTFADAKVPRKRSDTAVAAPFEPLNLGAKPKREGGPTPLGSTDSTVISPGVPPRPKADSVRRPKPGNLPHPKAEEQPPRSFQAILTGLLQLPRPILAVAAAAALLFVVLISLLLGRMCGTPPVTKIVPIATEEIQLPP